MKPLWQLLLGKKYWPRQVLKPATPMVQSPVHFFFPVTGCQGVPHGSVVKCLICNPGVLGSSHTRSSGFFVGVSLGKTLLSPSLVLAKSRKDMNNVNCRRDMTEILLKVVLTHSHTMTPFDAPGKQAFWKHCGKRRNCSQRAISPFPTVFSTDLDNFLLFLSNLKLSSANSFNLEESKICHLVVG